MYKETPSTNCLREELKIWKKEVRASYEDIADILQISKSHVYEFISRKKNVSYELGKCIENLVTLWSKEMLIKYKVMKKMEQSNDD